MIEPDEDLLASHPNDGFFKDVFSQPVYAATLFRRHLPAEIVEGIHWDTLALLPSSFVKQSLQQTHSDLLFSADMGGKETLLYLLFEHQTTPDPLMPLRLLGYVLEILRQHEREHGLPLPPVIPFVLHQGPQRWTPSPAFEDLFELPEGQAQALLPFLPKFRHALLDLSRFDPAAEETDTQMRVVLQLMKLAREKKLIEFFTWMATEIVLKSMPEDLLRLSLLYALHTDTNLDVEEIAHTLELNHELRENAMSIAQKLHARGKAEGEAKGKALGKLQLLQSLMGLPVSSEADLAGLSVSDIESRFVELEQRYKTEFKRL